MGHNRRSRHGGGVLRPGGDSIWVHEQLRLLLLVHPDGERPLRLLLHLQLLKLPLLLLPQKHGRDGLRERAQVRLQPAHEHHLRLRLHLRLLLLHEEVVLKELLVLHLMLQAEAMQLRREAARVHLWRQCNAGVYRERQRG